MCRHTHTHTHTPTHTRTWRHSQKANANTCTPLSSRYVLRNEDLPSKSHVIILKPAFATFACSICAQLKKLSALHHAP